MAHTPLLKPNRCLRDATEPVHDGHLEHGAGQLSSRVEMAKVKTFDALYIMFFIANLLLLPLGFLLIKGASTILKIPRSILMAIIVGDC